MLEHNSVLQVELEPLQIFHGKHLSVHVHKTNADICMHIRKKERKEEGRRVGRKEERRQRYTLKYVNILYCYLMDHKTIFPLYIIILSKHIQIVSGNSNSSENSKRKQNIGKLSSSN